MSVKNNSGRAMCRWVDCTTYAVLYETRCWDHRGQRASRPQGAVLKSPLDDEARLDEQDQPKPSVMWRSLRPT